MDELVSAGSIVVRTVPEADAYKMEKPRIHEPKTYWHQETSSGSSRDCRRGAWRAGLCDAAGQGWRRSDRGREARHGGGAHFDDGAGWISLRCGADVLSLSTGAAGDLRGDWAFA